MKHWTIKSMALILALALLLSLAGVAEDLALEGEALSPEAAPNEVSLLDAGAVPLSNAASAVPAALELGVKETYKLSTKGLGKKLTFKSSKAKVVKVSAKGVITGVKKGTAVITVTDANAKFLNAKVTK